jgi:hypothetical protein
MDDFNKAVKLYERLCFERSDHTFWSANLEEATLHLKTDIVWQNFYSYLNNNEHEFTSTMKPSLGDSIDNNTLGDVYKWDANEYNYKTVQNGNVTIMQVTPIKEIDDEKLNVLC